MRERGALAEASGQSRGTCEKKNLSPGKQGIYLENDIRPPCINICSPPFREKDCLSVRNFSREFHNRVMKVYLFEEVTLPAWFAYVPQGKTVISDVAFSNSWFKDGFA